MNTVEIGDKVFVYGTLRPGQRAGQMMLDMATRIGPTKVLDAAIYSVNGAFPGMKLNVPGHSVIGEVFEVNDKALGGRLDRYEGYPNLFDRRKVILECGTEAWAYTFNYAVEEKDLVKSGDWTNRGQAESA